jgi:hypothetical protein
MGWDLLCSYTDKRTLLSTRMEYIIPDKYIAKFKKKELNRDNYGDKWYGGVRDCITGRRLLSMYLGYRLPVGYLVYGDVWTKSLEDDQWSVEMPASIHEEMGTRHKWALSKRGSVIKIKKYAPENNYMVVIEKLQYCTCNIRNF